MIAFFKDMQSTHLHALLFNLGVLILQIFMPEETPFKKIYHEWYSALDLYFFEFGCFDSGPPHFKVSFYFFPEPVFVSYLCANELPEQSKKSPCWLFTLTENLAC